MLFLQRGHWILTEMTFSGGILRQQLNLLIMAVFEGKVMDCLFFLLNDA